MAEIDELIGKAERLHVLATECRFKDFAKTIEQDLRATKAWRDLVAGALKRET
jgi:hypothetical protein